MASTAPLSLSLEEIRDFMLKNGGKVTNLDLVKHFKRFLTNPNTQEEARKQFKTYVNILSTIKNEGKEKYIILRKKYINECPTDDSLSSLSQTDILLSPGSRSTFSEHDLSSFSEHGTSSSFLADLPTSPSGSVPPFKDPPPYKPPPPFNLDNKEHYRECVDEFKSAIEAFESRRVVERQLSVDRIDNDTKMPVVPPRKRSEPLPQLPMPENFVPLPPRNNSDVNLRDNHRDDDNDKENSSVSSSRNSTLEKQISVKEATQKFNQIACDEEAKVTSPPAKKKPEKRNEELSDEHLEFSSHPKSKEWLVSSARGNYQDMAKLSSEYPELVRLKDPTTYTALHWAAKHGSEDIVKLIAGTHRANVNARTNGGYTPLHLAMQFGKDNVFELLFNVYKADRDILDWSGKKPLDYRKIHTTVSASTYSKIKARKKHSEKDLGFLRIGSLNVRVKKTTEAFSNFLGVGNNQQRIPSHHIRSSAPPNHTYFDKMHKNWGSADNIPHSKKNIDSSAMPPPKHLLHHHNHHSSLHKKRRSKRQTSSGFRSVPTTPNQPRANSIVTVSEQTESADSDSACGFDSNWKDGDSGSLPLQQKSDYI